MALSFVARIPRQITADGLDVRVERNNAAIGHEPFDGCFGVGERVAEMQASGDLHNRGAKLDGSCLNGMGHARLRLLNDITYERGRAGDMRT